MSTPFLAEIRQFSFSFPPKGWALCNGQTLAIAQNQALFALLGTTYGGNGQTTFQLPNLRGRAPFHFGNGFVLGQAAGSTAVTLSSSQIPAHTHGPQGSTAAASQAAPANGVWATNDALPYSSATPNTTLAANAIANAGGNQPHANEQPYLTLNFCIALQGIFPSRS